MMSSSWLFIAQGVIVTLQYTLSAFIVGLVGGVLIAFLRHQNKLRRWIDGFISIIRGTPLILQLSLFYFAAPQFLGLRLSLFQAGILAFGLNSTAYMAEILRGGLQSLPRGQFEACQALGIPRIPMWRDIILPQLLTRVFPSLVNELISLLKESAVISMLGEMDIMRRAQAVAAQKFDYFGPLIMAALYYYFLVVTIERAGQWIEKKYFHAPGS